MLKLRLSQKLTGYLVAFMLVSFVVGCGGGGSDAGQSATTPTTPTTPATEENIIQIVANTGPIIAVRVGETVTLDGSKSFKSETVPFFTSSSDTLTYSWSFTHKPAASNSVLQNETTVNPSFVADARGVYIAQLVVSAEGISSERDIQTTVASVPGERLTGPYNHPGLSSDCVNCHSGDIDDALTGGKIIGKVAIHVATSKTCEACHTPQGFAIKTFVDHDEVFGNCSECHNGVLAIGKSEFHTPTDVECNECHNTTHFLELQPDGSFDHSNVTRACAGCHNGSVATGKTPSTDDTPPGTHPVTDSECGYCHTTASFLDAYPDHTGPDVVGPGITCDSCHVANGTGSAAGQSVGHPITNIDCDTCHSVVSFSMGGVFNHSSVDSTVQSCESCHNDNTTINAPGKSAATNHPVTSSDCGFCHNTRNFQDAFVDHTGPEVVGPGITCDSCHGVTATGKPDVGHVVTTDDCSVCHTPGTFTTGVLDHTLIVNGCAVCHDNVISVGKLINHIPTNPDNQDCADCHNTTDFTNTTFNHTGIDSSNCTLCHDGNISLGKSRNHVPTALDCSSCHDISNFSSFAGITFNHLGIDNNDCASCHNTGIATPKTVNHIPALSECSVCHDSTDTFTSTTFLTSVHQDLTRGCEGCHVSQFFPGNSNLYKSGTHLPTNQDCYLCHTVAAFVPSITPFLHTGISSNCASCHDGSTNNVAAGAIGKTDTPVHQNTNGDCSVCHNTTNFADAFVDHNGPEVVGKRCDSCHNGTDATGKGAKTNPPHVETTQDCIICHVPGGTFSPAVFNHDGIVDDCASCHDGTAATGLSQNHVPISANQDCSLCHNTTEFAGAKFNHQGIVNNCASCHNGRTAPGKIPPPDHVPTNDDCSVCHQTTGFIPATFDHTGIVDNCSSCHGAGFATGKSSNHVATTQDCGVCHNTRTFTGAVFDHTGIVDNCSSCHGVTAIGKHNAHIATNLDCYLCHTTATFVGGTWAHDASSAGRCDECHNNNGGGATFKPQGHLNTNEQCDACHSTDGWAPSIFRHDRNGNYPGDHRRDPGCTGCHKGSIGGGINSGNYPNQLRYAPSCAGCHAGDFRSEGDHIGGRSGTIEQNKNCGGSGCHRVSSSGF